MTSPPVLAGTSARRRLGRPLSARTRILFWYVLLLLAALAASLVATRVVLRANVDQRIAEELRSEAAELQTLARNGVDPQTGRRLVTTEELLRAGIDLGAPQSGTVVALLNGQVLGHVSRDPAIQLHRDQTVLDRWRSATTLTFGAESAPAGQVSYVVVPMRIGQVDRGAVAIAVLVDLEQHQADDVVLIAARASAVAFVLASLLAWLVAGQVLRPVRQVSGLANSIISESDLARRLPVPGRDEISQLAATFNRMLDRLATAFAAQRAFIDDAGHELRTPITVIRGHLDLPDDDAAERAQRREVVHDELDRMSRMVEDLLVLGKGERADFVVLDAVDLADLTTSIYTKAQTLDDRPWQLEQVGEGQVIADRQRITQAVLELARNAVQHSPEGATIQLGSALSDGEVRLWVRDQGPGVPAGDRDRVFERFARAGGSRRDTSGTGLGLAIVATIAEAHGGRVELGSDTGPGALFTLVIPVTPAREPDDEEFA